MNIFSALSAKAPNKVFASIILGMLAGIAYSLMIPIVVSSLSNNPDEFAFVNTEIRTFFSLEVDNYEIAKIFLINCVFILLARTVSQIILIRVSMDVTTDLRVQIYNRISKSTIDRLEQIGSSRLIATITTDVARIVGGARVLPDLLMNLAIIIGMLGFLSILNYEVFWFVLKAILIGGITYQIPVLLGNRYFERSRESVDALQESIRGLIYGAKELKLNKQKRESYFKDVLLHHEYALLNTDKTGHTIISAATNYGDLISFFVIGIVSFIFINYQSITSEELIGTIMALLYITTPIAVVLSFAPDVIMAKISLKTVNRLLEELPAEEVEDEIQLIPDWQTISFRNVSFQHEPDDNDDFELGPIDFEIEKNKITFIVGGNGSGKSTLSKLVTLHYTASSGEIYFGDTQVTRETITTCRQSISAIFSDYYLFDRMLGNISVGKEDIISRYLHELGLDKKVTITDGHFSSTTLSDGQRRRLALLVAFLEDKEIYLFDEWAADQDPMFKEFFYHKVLPQLKSKGKAVVVISHDDRYFDVADKILVMESGQLVDCITDQHQIAERTKNRSMLVNKKQLEIA